MIYYTLNIAKEIEYHEPDTYTETVNGREMDSWLKAMKEEIDSLETNGTWLLINKPKAHKLVSCKWIYKKNVEVT